MSARPKWSASGFARRVAMSEMDLWVIVEGRDHDRPHYEKLLHTLPSTKDLTVSLRLAEETEVNGIAAGGKAHALSLHDYLEAADDLVQSNRSGKSNIVFLLDRDRDDFSDTIRSSAHVFYTDGTDVEADILLNSDLWAAICSAYGIDSRIADKVRTKVADPAKSLVDLWDDWLRLGLAALACGTPGCAPWAQFSKVNPSNFDPVDIGAVAAVHVAIQKDVVPADYETALTRAGNHVSIRGTRLIKGRWLARYVGVLVKTHLASEVVRVNVPPNSVIDTALAGLQYDSSWSSAYELQFSRLLTV